MRQITILIVALMICLAGCAAATPQATVTLSALPTETQAMPPTSTPTALPTATPPPTFKAGIPETVEECSLLELQFKPDGSIDGDWFSKKLNELSVIEHAWLEQYGYTVDKIGFFKPYDSGIKSNDMFPYSILPIHNGNGLNLFVPTSCTRLTFQGNEYVMYGFAGRRSFESNQFAIIHGVYDFIGYKSNIIKLNAEEYYNKHYTPELVFQHMHNLKEGKRAFNTLVFFLGGYANNESQYENWKISNALITANDIPGNVDQGGTPYLVRYFYGFQDSNPTAEEEKQWITQVEQYAYPLELIEPPIN